MKKEELQNYPKLAAAELEEALETAVSRPVFPCPDSGPGSNIFSVPITFTRKRQITSGPTASGRDSCGWHMSVPAIPR